MRPDPYARAIAGVVRDLLRARLISRKKSLALRLHYDLPGNHPLVGFSAPDLEFEDGSRLGELLRNGTGLLLDLAANKEMQARTQRWSEHVKYVPRQPKDNLGLAAFLVRPDGFVAWATDQELDLRNLEETLEMWFGTPS